MIWIAKLTFCGGISKIPFCPITLCLDGEVVWSSLDHYKSLLPHLGGQRQLIELSAGFAPSWVMLPKDGQEAVAVSWL